MNEAGRRNLRAVEDRAILNRRETLKAKLRDRFGRGVFEGDGVLLSQTSAFDVVWRVTKLTPATEPQYQGGIWADVRAETRVLCQQMVPQEHVILVLTPPPAAESGDDAREEASAPASAVSPGGIILTDPDGQSKR